MLFILFFFILIIKILALYKVIRAFIIISSPNIIPSIILITLNKITSLTSLIGLLRNSRAAYKPLLNKGITLGQKSNILGIV